jgi:hypothetical protein
VPRSRTPIQIALIAAGLSAAAILCACGSPGPDRLTSVDPAGRMNAAARAAAAGDVGAVPLLVEMLQSDDPAERMVAIGALERLTGERRGFAAPASPGSRAEAVARWYQWLESGEPARRGDGPPTVAQPSGPLAHPDR